MFTNAVSKNAKGTLAILGKSGLLSKAYLAGGTACALWFGHRYSFDLDFFTDVEFETELTVKQLESFPGFMLQRTEKWTILGTFPEVKFSFFYYPYPLIEKASPFMQINIASLPDLAAMKVAAICDRGTKRDFIDLYSIVKEKFSLKKALSFYDRKYKKLSNNAYHIIRSLQYFRDADKEQEMPQMIEKISWEEVKKFFTGETKSLTKKLLKI